MAFVKKTWKNRISEFFNRYRLENVSTGQVTNAYINLNDGAVEEEGDKINADALNDLEDRINTGFNSVIDKSAIVNNLTTTTSGKVLDARQGKVLKELIDSAGGGSEDMIAGVESTSIASQAYTIGQYLIYNGILYRVKTAIAVGNTLNVGTNIIATKIADELANHLVVSGTEFYFDYQGGEFGYNTSANRGADTFHPFKNARFNINRIYILTYGYFEDMSGRATVSRDDGVVRNYTYSQTQNQTVDSCFRFNYVYETAWYLTNVSGKPLYYLYNGAAVQTLQPNQTITIGSPIIIFY